MTYCEIVISLASAAVVMLLIAFVVVPWGRK